MLRLVAIAIELMRFGLGVAWSRMPWSQARLAAPDRLCVSLARLGTTFIKFGQALSLRPEMLPPRYIAALQSLQDHIAPFPAADAFREIERGFGRKVDELFAYVGSEPLAAASVAQLHAARLADGRAVIVKVRRKEAGETIDRDMKALMAATRAVMRVSPRLRHYQPLWLIEEIWRNLRKEIDFRQEARNITTFAAAFADWPTIHVPAVIDGLVCESVIVQERSVGLRIDDSAVAPQGPRLAQNFVDAYLHQIFVLGLFHGDPHPGNLFITADGRICFHDFGLTGFLDRGTRQKLAAFTQAFLHQDADWLLDAGIDLGVLGGDMDRGTFRHGLAEIVADYSGRPLKEWSLAEAFLRIARLGRNQNVFMPYELAILMRTMFLAEHVVRILDPEFALLASLKAKGPAILAAAVGQMDMSTVFERLKSEALGAMQELPAVLNSWVARLRREGDGLGLTLRVADLHRMTMHRDRSDNRITLALITAGLYLAGALVMPYDVGPRLLNDLPTLAAFFYLLALWFTIRLVWAIKRSGGL